MDSLLRELASIDSVSTLQADYRKTLALLRALKAGSISLDNVTMTDTGWTVAEVESVPVPTEASTEPLDEGE